MSAGLSTAECRDCGFAHANKRRCPECGACDFTVNVAGVGMCWNCPATILGSGGGDDDD
jgi:hypothetical protein